DELSSFSSRYKIKMEKELKEFKDSLGNDFIILRDYFAFVEDSNYYIACLDIDGWSIIKAPKKFNEYLNETEVFQDSFKLIDQSQIESLLNNKNVPFKIKKTILFNLSKFQ